MIARGLWRETYWTRLPDHPMWLADAQVAASAVDAVACRLWQLSQITGDESLRRDYAQMERAHLQLDQLAWRIALVTPQGVKVAA